jgi:hypothetical protein
VSRDNPDPSAKNIGEVLDAAGFARSDVLLWNVVPYCVSTETQNRNATAAHIREADPRLSGLHRADAKIGRSGVLWPQCPACAKVLAPATGVLFFAHSIRLQRRSTTHAAAPISMRPFR